MRSTGGSSVTQVLMSERKIYCFLLKYFSAVGKRFKTFFVPLCNDFVLSLFNDVYQENFKYI